MRDTTRHAGQEAQGHGPDGEGPDDRRPGTRRPTRRGAGRVPSWLRVAVTAAVALALAASVALVQGVWAEDAPNAANPTKGRLTTATFEVQRTGGGTESASRVSTGTSVEFSLTFEISGNSLSEGDSQVSYVLPAGIVIDGSQVSEQALMGTGEQAGKRLGSWNIVTDADGTHRVVMTFEQGTGEDQVPDLFAQGLVTTLTFWARAENSSVTDELPISFDGAGTLVVEPGTPSISIQKAVEKQKAYDRWGSDTGDLADGEGNRDRHATYTVTVGTTTGTGRTVSISDAMAAGTNVASAAYDRSSFSLVRYESADDAQGSPVTIDDPQLSVTDGARASFELTGLAALPAGGRYVLTYQATVTETDHGVDTTATNSATARIENDARDISASANATATWKNIGDASIRKYARLTDYANPNDPTERRVEYQLVIYTKNGTGTRIQVGDTVTPGANIDTSSWRGHETESFFDHDSFSLRKYTGTYQPGQTIDSDGGTERPDLLEGKPEWTNDGGKPSFSFSIDEPLEAGEYYVLTYTGTVHEVDHDAPDTSLNNGAVVRIYPGGKETKLDAAQAPVSWHNDIKKTGTFSAASGFVTWQVEVNRTGLGSAMGLAMDDVLPGDLVSSVRVMRGGSVVRTLDLLSDGSQETDGVAGDPSTYDPATRALHVALGSWADQNASYTIVFTTKAPAGSSVGNQAVEVRGDGGRFGTPRANVRIARDTSWGLTKRTGAGTAAYDQASGTYVMSWGLTATMPDSDLVATGEDGILRLSDRFADITAPDGSSTGDYAGRHYAVASELYAELTGRSDSGASVTLALHGDVDANGQPRSYTLRDGSFVSGTGDAAVTLSGVELVPTLYARDGSVIADPATSLERAYGFDLVLRRTSDGTTLNGRTLTVSNYHTRVDASGLAPSTQVSVGNSASSDHGSSFAHAQPLTTLSRPLEKQVRTLVSSGQGAPSRGEGSSRTFLASFADGWQKTVSGDKDATTGDVVLSDNSDGHSAGMVQFRIAVNTTSLDENAKVVVTDTLPEGLTFVNSRWHPVRLVGYVDGAYRELSGSYFEGGTTPTGGDYASTSAASVSADGRTLTFTFGLGSATAGGGNLPRGQYYITYCASFGDDPAWNDLTRTSRSYENAASVTMDGHEETDRATVNVTRVALPAYKSQRGELSNDRRGRYQIVINPAGADLAAGRDTVELVDTLTASGAHGWNSQENGTSGHMNPELDLNSVHLYAYSPSASDGLGAEVDKTSYSLKYEHADGADGYRRIRVSVPDATPLVLVYDYEFNRGEDGDWGTRASDGSLTVSVGNTATIAGSTTSEVVEAVRRSAQSGTVFTRAMYLYKVDADNYAHTLDGSVFDLYQAGEDGSWECVERDIGGGSTTAGTYRPHIFTLVDTSTIQRHDVLYKLVETTAPAGYGCTVKYVVLLDSGETEEQAWEAITGSADGRASAQNLDAYGNPVTGDGGAAVPITRAEVSFVQYTGGSVYVEDAYESVRATKSWVDEDGNAISGDDKTLPASVTLQLERSVEGSPAWADYGEPVEVTAADGWAYEWQNLPQGDASGRAYLYRVKELPVEGWRPVYEGNDGISAGQIHVTNWRDYSLPNAGGTGVAALSGVGVGIVGGSAALLAWRRRKQRA